MVEGRLRTKLECLQGIMAGLQPGVIAFSGGVDSRLLASLADTWNLDFALVTVAGPHYTRGEFLAARIWHGCLDLESHVLSMDPLDFPLVRANREDRCYHCKRHLFGGICDWARERRRPHVLEGSQISDTSQYRPGRKALGELGVHSPLSQAGFDKEDVRAVLTDMSDPYPTQPSRPCLLTRFAYGLAPHRELLISLGHAEDGLMALGLKEFRIRVLHGKRYCLQVDERERDAFHNMRQPILSLLARTGFTGADIQFTSRVSGYYDQENDRS